MQFVKGYNKAFNEQGFSLNIGEEFKSIGKKAYEKAEGYWKNLSISDKKEVADKFPEYFYGLLTNNMEIQKTMFYVE